MYSLHFIEKFSVLLIPEIQLKFIINVFPKGSTLLIPINISCFISIFY